MSEEFKDVAIGEGWGHADDGGFRIDDDPRGAGREFIVCKIEGGDIGVFVGQNIGPAERKRLFERRPTWLAAVVFADVASCTRELAALDIELSSDAELARCAFGTVCSVFAAGAFDVTPARYLVRAGVHGSLTVTATFDDDAERWFGEVR